MAADMVRNLKTKHTYSMATHGRNERIADSGEIMGSAVALE